MKSARRHRSDASPRLRRRAGRLNQEVAAAGDRVTLMAAGLPLTLKEPA